MDTPYDEMLVSAAEFIKNRFFFVSLRSRERPKSTVCTHYFSIDTELCYESFFNDFGPLNISMLFHYCIKLNKKLNSAALKNKRIVHYTNHGDHKRVNAAYLACSYMIIFFNYTPERVYALLLKNNSETFNDFRDASVGVPFTISLENCLNAIYKAHNMKMFNFNDFDFMEYEHYERVENGDLNWIIPGKLIGFCGPQNRSLIENGYPIHSPETYFSYFRRHDVTTIIRFNKKMYDASKFIAAGFDHKDLYFVDGSTPSDRILYSFLSTCEKTDGAIAIHCKAGLGRTGTLIACYIMKHYKFTAQESVAWVRICRPGSIIGHQNPWLLTKQDELWEAGDLYRAALGITEPVKCSHSIYSYCHTPDVSKKLVKRKPELSGILAKVNTMQLEDQDSVEEEVSESLSQGDQLNQIKSRRQSQRLGANDKKGFRTQIVTNPLDNGSVVTVGKVAVRGNKNSTTSPRKTTKRDSAKQRRTSLRKSSVVKISTETSPSSAINKPQTKNRRSTTNKEALLQVAEISGSTDTQVVKRAKRSLTLEKEKADAHAVKMLRQSSNIVPVRQTLTVIPFRRPANLPPVIPLRQSFQTDLEFALDQFTG